MQHRHDDPFVRNRTTLSEEEQQRLQQSRVAVIGCGGLGGYVIEELARVGTGNLLLFDPDTFEQSNLNRQLYACSRTMGRNKAEVAAERVRRIHNRCRTTACREDFRDHLDLLQQQGEVIVDCLDNDRARRALGRFCRHKAIPLVHGAVKGWYGQVAVQLPGRNLMSLLYPAIGDSGHGPATPSVLACTVATVASLQTAEVIKILLQYTSPLHANWLSMDLLRSEFDLIPVPQ